MSEVDNIVEVLERGPGTPPTEYKPTAQERPVNASGADFYLLEIRPNCCVTCGFVWTHTELFRVTPLRGPNGGRTWSIRKPVEPMSGSLNSDLQFGTTKLPLRRHMVCNNCFEDNLQSVPTAVKHGTFTPSYLARVSAAQVEANKSTRRAADRAAAVHRRNNPKIIKPATLEDL